MQILLILIIIALLVIWATHPLNPWGQAFHRKHEFNHYRKIERAWRNYRKNKPHLPQSALQKRVWRMDEMEFEEWATSIWIPSRWWYEIRLQAWRNWVHEKQFEILQNPSPTDDEMQKVIYMPTAGKRA